MHGDKAGESPCNMKKNFKKIETHGICREHKDPSLAYRDVNQQQKG